MQTDEEISREFRKGLSRYNVDFGGSELRVKLLLNPIPKIKAEKYHVAYRRSLSWTREVSPWICKLNWNSRVKYTTCLSVFNAHDVKSLSSYLCLLCSSEKLFTITSISIKVSVAIRLRSLSKQSLEYWMFLMIPSCSIYCSIKVKLLHWMFIPWLGNSLADAPKRRFKYLQKNEQLVLVATWNYCEFCGTEENKIPVASFYSPRPLLNWNHFILKAFCFCWE